MGIFVGNDEKKTRISTGVVAMSKSDSQRFSRLWKSVAVSVLLLTIAGSLGVYVYAQRQYAAIRDAEHRGYRTVIRELRQYLQTTAETAPTGPAETFRQNEPLDEYMRSEFQHFPALARLLVLDRQGDVVWGRERPEIVARLVTSDAGQALSDAREEYGFGHTIQLPLAWNRQSELFVRGDFFSTSSIASFEQLTQITIQITLISIIGMVILGIALMFTQISGQFTSRQQRLEEYVVSLQRSNEHLLRTQKELQISEKLASLGYLAAGVAHEIGNPLAAVLGYIELLQKTVFEPEKQRDILQRAEQEIERIRRIIQELVTFSRPHSIQRQRVDVNTLVREIVARIPASSEKTLDIQLHLTTFPLLAEVDPQKLQSVLYNILCNAIDATPASGQIRFSTSRRIHESAVMIGSSEVVTIECTDTGGGIPEDQAGRIFDPFFTTKEPGKGMGLGLSLCHRIIESLHGDIVVRSAVGQGTTVTIYLPPASTNPTRNTE